MDREEILRKSRESGVDEGEKRRWDEKRWLARGFTLDLLDGATLLLFCLGRITSFEWYTIIMVTFVIWSVPVIALKLHCYRKTRGKQDLVMAVVMVAVDLWYLSELIGLF